MTNTRSAMILSALWVVARSNTVFWGRGQKMSLRINAEAPIFTTDTTQREINFHQRSDGGSDAPLPYLRIVPSA